MFGAVFGLIGRALASAPVAILTAAAVRIGSLVKRKVVASPQGILTAVREFVGRNPAKIAVAVGALSSVGLDMGADAIQRAFDEDGITDADSLRIVGEMQERLRAQRAALTGDGKDGTAHGMTNSEYEDVLVRFNVVAETIDRAIGPAGGLENLLRIRAAVFLEDTDFEMYRKFRS